MTSFSLFGDSKVVEHFGLDDFADLHRFRLCIIFVFFFYQRRITKHRQATTMESDSSLNLIKFFLGIFRVKIFC